MLKQTLDYSIFKKHDHNRVLCESNINKIMRSIKIKNLLQYRPILVDKEMRVIDGQHRLEAAMRLQIPIFYDTKEDVSTDDIILLNDNSKNWGREDYLNYHCAQGNVEYLKLRSFLTENKINLSLGLSILCINQKNDNKNGGDFKNGRIIFPTAHEVINSVHILSHSREIIEYIHPKMDGAHRFIFGAHFRRGLYLFLSIKAVEFPIFMDKLAHRMDLIRPCARIQDFVNIFKLIYNWRNRNPITLDEFAITD